MFLETRLGRSDVRGAYASVRFKNKIARGVGRADHRRKAAGSSQILREGSSHDVWNYLNRVGHELLERGDVHACNSRKMTCTRLLRLRLTLGANERKTAIPENQT